jgi:hypothetical protein
LAVMRFAIALCFVGLFNYLNVLRQHWQPPASRSDAYTHILPHNMPDMHEEGGKIIGNYSGFDPHLTSPNLGEELNLRGRSHGSLPNLGRAREG